MADITLLKPQAGTTQTLTPHADDRLVLDFSAADTTLSREGDDLIMSFDDGATVVLSDFYVAYSAEQMPSFIMDGVEVAGEDFFAALGEELMPAAGATSTQSLGSGSGVDTIATSLQGGLDSLSGLDQAYSASTSELSEAHNVIDAQSATRRQATQESLRKNAEEEQQKESESSDYIPPKITVNVGDNGDGTVSKEELGGPNGNQVEVTVTLEEGVEEGDKIVIEQNGEVVFEGPVTDSMLEDGLTLWVDPPVDGGQLNVEATVTTEDGATATETETVTVEDTIPPTASITLDPVTDDDILNAVEADSHVDITGTVGGDVKAGDTVTVTVNGKDYFGTVNADKSFTISVPGSELLEDTDVKASVTTSDEAGNTTTAHTDGTYEVDTTLEGDFDGTVTSHDAAMVEGAEVQGVSLPEDAGYDFEGSISAGDADNPFGSFSVNAQGKLVFTQNETYKHGENEDSASIEVKIPIKDTAGNEAFVTVTVTVGDSGPEVSATSHTELTVEGSVATGSIAVDFGSDMDGASITLGGNSVTWNAESNTWEAATSGVETSYDGDVYTIKMGDVTMTSKDNQNWEISHVHNDTDGQLEFTFTDGDGDSLSHTMEINDAPIAGTSSVTLTETSAGADITGHVDVDFGIDGQGTFAWNVENQPSISTLEGTEVTWSVDGDVLMGTADGKEVLSVTMEKDADGNYTGEYTVDVKEAIDHKDDDSADVNFGFSITDADGESSVGSVSVTIQDSDVTLTEAAKDVQTTAGDRTVKQASDYFDEGADLEGGEYTVLGAKEATRGEDGTITYDFDWGSVNMNPETGEYTVEGNGSGDGSFDVQYTDGEGDSAKTTVKVENSIVVVDISIDSVRGFVDPANSTTETGMVTVNGTVSTVDTTNESNTMTVTLEYNGELYTAEATANGDGTYSYSVNIPSDAIIESSGEIKIAGDGIKTSVEITDQNDELLANDSTVFSYSYFNKAADADEIVGTQNTDVIEGVILDLDSLENKTNATNIGSAVGNEYHAHIDTAAGDDVLSFKSTGAHAYNIVSLKTNTVVLETGTGDDSLVLDTVGTKTGYSGVVGIKAEGDSAQNTIDMGAGNDNISLTTGGVGYFKFAIVARDKDLSNGTETFNKIDLGSGDDTFYVQGEIEGDGAKNIILGGEGNDTLTAVGADALKSPYTFEAIKKGGANEVDLGTGNDVLNIEKGEASPYAIFASTDGTNTFKLGEGDDTFNLDGTMFAHIRGQNTVDMGAGDDSVDITGTMYAYNHGNNTVNMGDGNDSFSMTGEIKSDYYSNTSINLGAGDDTFDLESRIYSYRRSESTLEAGDGDDTVNIQGDMIASSYSSNTIDMGEGDDSVVMEGNTTASSYSNNTIDMGAGDDSIVVEGNMTATSYSSNTIDMGAGNDSIRLEGNLASDATSSNTINGGEGDDIFTAVDFTAAAKAYLNGGEGYDAFIYETEGDTFMDFSQVGSIDIGGVKGMELENFESVTTGSGDDLINMGSNTEGHMDAGAGFDIVLADGSLTDTDMSEILQNSLNTEMFIFSNDADVAGSTSTEEAMSHLEGVTTSANGEIGFGANWTEGETTVHNGTEYQTFMDENSETTIMVAKAILENTNL